MVADNLATLARGQLVELRNRLRGGAAEPPDRRLWRWRQAWILAIALAAIWFLLSAAFVGVRTSGILAHVSP